MKFRLSNALFLAAFLCAGSAQAATYYKPYCLSNVASTEVVAKLEAAGFVVAGEYEPYADAKVIVITSEDLKKAAAGSEFGGYSAVVRVAVTGKQVSYTNLTYWANGYRLATDKEAVTLALKTVKSALKTALGACDEFGSEDGMTESQLRKYHYMMGMPYFTDPIELATHTSYEKAVETVEANLKAGKGSTKFVSRVDLSGKSETVFGMGVLGTHDGADKVAMTILNKYSGTPQHTAYMPYEILVADTKVYMLHGKFRMALSFPDLSMWQFMKIRNAPAGIEEAATAVAAPPKK